MTAASLRPGAPAGHAPADMAAAVQAGTGPAAEVLRVVRRPVPTPGPGEVRVRIAYSGVNPSDCKRRAGVVPAPAAPADEPIPHQDGSGVIDAVGPGVATARLGQRVWLYHTAARGRSGTAAEYACAPGSQAVELPAGVPLSQGAGLGVPAITAHRCLFADGELSGRTVLVTGGAGAVGHAAIGLARHGGARVIATVSSDEKARLAERAGAHEVVRYRDEGAADRLRAVAPEGYHRVVDVALDANLATYADALADHAVVASYAGADHAVELPLRWLRRRNVALRFVLVYELTEAMLAAATADVTQALASGALAPLPTHHFGIERIAAAHEAVEGGAVGKVLIDLGGEPEAGQERG